MTSPEPTPNGAEELVPGLLRERRYDGRLLILTLTTVLSRAVVDAWYDAVVDYIHACEDTGRFLVYDASPVPMALLSAYMRQRATALAELDPEGRGRLAIIMSLAEPFRSLVRIFVQQTSRVKQPHLDIKVFTTPEEGIAWVVEGLEDYLSSASR